MYCLTMEEVRFWDPVCDSCNVCDLTTAYLELHADTAVHTLQVTAQAMM